MALVFSLRHHYKVNIKTAVEMGYFGRDDTFQFHEAKRRGRFLLTSDMGFLKHRDFPFNQMLGVVILDISQEPLGLGYIHLWLTKEIVPSGKGIEGTKIVVHTHTLDVYWLNKEGKICKQVLPLS